MAINNIYFFGLLVAAIATCCYGLDDADSEMLGDGLVENKETEWFQGQNPNFNTFNAPVTTARVYCARLGLHPPGLEWAWAPPPISYDYLSVAGWWYRKSCMRPDKRIIKCGPNNSMKGEMWGFDSFLLKDPSDYQRVKQVCQEMDYRTAQPADRDGADRGWALFMLRPEEFAAGYVLFEGKIFTLDPVTALMDPRNSPNGYFCVNADDERDWGRCLSNTDIPTNIPGGPGTPRKM